MKRKINNEVFKEFIDQTSNFFKKKEEKCGIVRHIFVDAAFNDHFTVYATMKISSAVAEILGGDIIALAPLRGNRRARAIIQSFHPKYILNYKFFVLKGFIKYFFRVMKHTSSIITGDDLVRLKEMNLPIGMHIYDDILRRYNLSTVDRLSFKQKLFVMLSISFFYAMYNFISSQNFFFAIIPDNTYRDGLIFEIIKAKEIPSISGIDINGISMHKYESNIDYQYHCRTPDNELINTILGKEQVNLLIENYIELRTKGEEKQHDVMRAYSKNKIMINREILIREHNLDPNKPLIAVMAHIFCDAPHGYPQLLFKDYEDWLCETCEALVKNCNVEFFVKEHPSVSLYNEEGVIERILGRLGLLNKLLKKNINTRSLFTVVDAVITCGGTAGMEFPCFGVPVLLAAKPAYAYFSYVVSPDTKQGYLNEIKKIHEYKKLSNDEVKKAKAVLFTIHYLMKFPKRNIGLGTQEYYLGSGFDFEIFMKEMIDDYASGNGYQNLLEVMEVFLKSRYKNLLDFDKIRNIL